MVIFFRARFIFPFIDTFCMVTRRDGKLRKAAYWKRLEEQIEKVNAELEKTVEERDDALKRLETLMEENEKLRSRLRACENPNTPSSTQRFKKAGKEGQGKARRS